MASVPTTSSGLAEDELLEKLPGSIVKKLRTLVRRVRRVQLIRGVSATVACAAVAVIAIMLISAVFTILSPTVHACLTTCGVLAVVATAFRTLFIPLRKAIPLSHIARVIETRHPELNESLSTAMSLTANRDSDALRGSEELVSKIVDGAVSDAKSLRPKREFSNRSSRRYLIGCAGAAVLFALGFLVFPSQSSRLATRAIAPFSKVGNAFADRLEVEPGDARLPTGDPITITVTIADAEAKRAEIRRTNQGESEIVETMTFVGKDEEADTAEFAITFPSITEAFSYRVRSGRAVSQYHEVDAIERPTVKRLEVSYQFPEYTRLVPVTITEPDQAISAVAGTKIQIVANFDRALDSAVLKVEGNPYPAINDTSDNPQNPRSAWSFEMADGIDGAWELALEDTESIPSRPNKQPIRSIADQPPAVRLLTDKTELRLKPDERLSLRYEVDEDFGLSSAKLQIAGRERAFEQTLPALSSSDLYAGTAILDLSKVTNDSGAAEPLEVYLSVTDNHPDGQETKAGPITIVIDSGAQSLAEQQVSEQRQSLQSALAGAIEQLESAKRLATEIPRQLLKPEEIPAETLVQLGEIQTLMGKAEGTVRDTATAVSEQESLFKELSAQLNQIVDDHLAPARLAAGEIPLLDAQVTRVHRATKLNRQLDEGIADLNVAIRELKQHSSHAKLLTQMSEFSDRQQQLADQLAAASSPEEIEQLMEQQAQLAKAMEQFADSSDRSVADELQDARKSAADLASIASELSTEQEALTKMLNQAADPAQRNAAVRELLSILEREQREIGQRATGLRDAQNSAESAAEALKESRLADAAKTGSINGNFLQEMSKPQLATEQKAIASQVKALADDQLDAALAARQSAIAAEAEKLAQGADNFRDRAESLADPSALQQVQKASVHANDAARSAHQASSQLGGDNSTGAFEFAKAPDNFPPNQNGNPNAGPAPTQAGVETKEPGDPGYKDDKLPDMTKLDGVRESPFSPGLVSDATPPPALRDGEISLGGDGARPSNSKTTTTESTPATTSSSGQDSIASAAQQPAMQAQHGLADASTALNNAAGNLGQQANSPSAQRPPEIDQRIVNAARQAAQAAIEKNPALAAKIAQTVAKNLSAPSQPNAPDPNLQNWQDIRGKVKSGVAAGTNTQTPEEYRDLVKRYFKELARRNNSNSK